MPAVLVNTAAVLCGSLIGILFSSRLNDRLRDAVMKALGLCTMLIGVQSALKTQELLCVILCMVIGTVIGELLRIDDGIEHAGDAIKAKLPKGKGGGSRFTEGFVSASILFCIGSMTIVGSLQAGLVGDNTMLFTKSLLDFISSIMFSASMGIGVMFAAVFVLVFQGAIVLAAQAIAPFLSEPVVAEMTCVGSLLILGIGINLTGIGKLKLMNYLPAIFVPIFILRFFG